MSFSKLNLYPPGVATERGKPVQLGKDPKGKSFIYCSGANVVIRDLANPLVCDVYQEHNVATSVAKYSPSGNYIASGDSKGIVRIWDATQKEHILKFEMPALGGRVADLDWTDDSKRIVVVGEGREFFGRAFMFDSGSSCGEVTGVSKHLISCSIKQTRPYRLALGGEDADVNFSHGVPFKWVKSIKSDAQRFINSVRYSPDGSRFVTGSADKLIQIYEGKEGDKTGALPVEHTGGVYSLDWNAAGDKLISASGDKTCKTWDMNTLQCIQTFTFGNDTNDQQLGCMWSGDYLLSVSLSGDINYLDASNPGKPRKVVHGHQNFITALAYDGGNIYSGSYDSVINKWEEKTGNTFGLHGKGHSSQINGLAHDGSNLISGSMDSTVRVTPVASLEYGASFGTDSDIVSVAAGKKTKGLIVAAALKSLLHVSAGKSTQVKIDFTASCIDLNPAENQAAVGGDDGKIRIYALSGGSLALNKTIDSKGKITQVAYSPDGQWLATVSNARDFIIWAVADWSVKNNGWGSFATASINCVAWTPNSQFLASGSLDQNIIIWSMAKKTKRTKIDLAHKGGVNRLLWINDTTLLSAGQDNAVKTWTIVHH